MMKTPLKISLMVAACAVLVGGGFFAADRLKGKLTGATVESRLADFGAAVDARWKPWFDRAKVAYPAKRYTWVALKDQKVLRVYAEGSDGALRFIRELPILAASGGLGPKLREGDRQVPEGVYAVESLNPRSLYHVALRVNYPNAADRAVAAQEGRTNLGGDIMIHGKSASIGCLAMGDAGAEDLFTLAARAGCSNLTLIFAPTDFRKNPDFAPPPGSAPWVAARYAEIRRAMERLP